MAAPGEISQQLGKLSSGDRAAEEELIRLVYTELRRSAARYMRRERPDHTLQATALVHEAYIRLRDQKVSWKNRAHFYAVAAQQMRRILVDYARKQKAARREGAEKKVQLEEALVIAREQPRELVAVHEALDRFAREHKRGSQVVELRFFGGRTEGEIAEMLGVSVETVKRDWRFAKAWLAVQLRGAEPQ